jgi:hypothetical protein
MCWGYSGGGVATSTKSFLNNREPKAGARVGELWRFGQPWLVLVYLQLRAVLFVTQLGLAQQHTAHATTATLPSR